MSMDINLLVAAWATRIAKRIAEIDASRRVTVRAAHYDTEIAGVQAVTERAVRDGRA